jgi:isocitrate dehydrogenase (NAD+)
MSMKVATEKACPYLHWAFDTPATVKGKDTVLHKANIMKLTDGLFIRKSKEASKEYGDIQYEEMIIDAGCMKLVQDPALFDMLLLENLYGDLISDLCAGLVGGLGVVPGANIGDREAVFEAVHGSAPDIAVGVANRSRSYMSGVMMLIPGGYEGRKDFRACAVRIKTRMTAPFRRRQDARPAKVEHNGIRRR